MSDGTEPDYRSLERVDELMVYVDDEGGSHPASLGGMRARSLYAQGLIDTQEATALADLATVVDAEGHICDDLRLLDAWLTYFELITSVKAHDAQRAQQPEEE
jgi:hypothetical protein